MVDRKAIILSGGKGTRLYPCTASLSKQIIPIYDKPMIYYSLAVAMHAKIKEVLIISSQDHLHFFENLLGNGSQLGMKIQYKVQQEPRGLPEAFLLGEEFLEGKGAFLILGDNLFYGNDLSTALEKENQKQHGASIFTMHVQDPERYGVIYKKDDKYEIIEKPKSFVGNNAVTGMYFFDRHVCEYSKSLKPSQRQELEITDLIRVYMMNEELSVHHLRRGMAWLDTGTPDSLLQASQFVQIIEARQGQKIACLEEISLRNSWITMAQFDKLIGSYPNCDYKNYLCEVGREFLI